MSSTITLQARCHLHEQNKELKMPERRKPQLPRRSLENEIIIAVVILYLLIAGVMVAIHYMQPKGQETSTSSTSPSHSDQSTTRENK